MTKPGRIPCLALGCRRTADASKYPAGTRIICGKFWRLAPRVARIECAKVSRELEMLNSKLNGIVDSGSNPIITHPDLVDRYYVAEARHADLWKEIEDAVQAGRTGL